MAMSSLTLLSSSDECVSTSLVLGRICDYFNKQNTAKKKKDVMLLSGFRP
jgi:hypothetical protein